MWLLLVAAGSGYLARCWQNALKPRPALTDCAQTSSSPETPTNAASAAYGSPTLSRERRSGTNKEDAHGSKTAQELRRQLSSGGRSFQAKGLGRKLLYDTCGQGSSRFSRSEDGSESNDERKVFIEDQLLLSDQEDTGACCCLAGTRRSDVTESFASPMTETKGWTKMSDDNCSQEPCADVYGEETKDYSICPRPTSGAVPDQDENTFEIPLSEVERFRSHATVSSLPLSKRSSPQTHIRDTRTGSSGEMLSRKTAAKGASPSSISTCSGGSHASVSNGNEVLDDLDLTRSGNGISNVVLVVDAGKLGACNEDRRMHLPPQSAAKCGEEGAIGQPQVDCCVDSQRVVNTDVDHALDVRTQQGSVMQAINVLADNLTLSCDKLQGVECEAEVCYQYQERNVLGQADHSSSIRGPGLNEIEVFTSGLDVSPVNSCSLNSNENSAGIGPTSEQTGNILLSFLSAKRVKDITKDDSRDATEDSSGASLGKRKKDSNQGRKHVADQESLARHISSGLLDSSLGCLGFDANWFEVQPNREEKLKYGVMPRKIKTPSKCGRPRSSTRKIRWLRGSTKVVSSLESCLRAQLLHDCEEKDGYRIARTLDFPVISPEEEAVPGAGDFDHTTEESTLENLVFSGQGNSRLTVPGDASGQDQDSEREPESGLVRLELCKSPESLQMVKESDIQESESWIPSQLTDASSKTSEPPLTMKKRKILERGRSPAASPAQLDRDLVVLPMDGLLFSFGVGVGVMSMVNTSKEEVEKIYLQLKQAEDYVECLKQELELKKGPNSRKAFSKLEKSQENDSLSLKAPDGGEAGCTLSFDHNQEHPESATSEGTVEIMESGTQMAELEAELEAELQLMERNLTGESSLCHRRQFSGLSDLDLDGVANVIEGDLQTSGLPRPQDPDDDQIDSTHEDIQPTSWAVSPRDLDRRLQKVLIARQEESIAELESELSAAESKLMSKENELQWWKDRVQKLTDLACLPSKSGMSPGDSVEGPESFLFPVDNVGHWKAMYLTDVDISPGQCTTGTPAQYANREKRQGMSASKALSEASPAVDKSAGVESISFSEVLASEAAHDDVCDEFLKAVTDTDTRVCKEEYKLRAGDPLLLTEDDEPVLDSENSPDENASLYGKRSVSLMPVQPKQVGYSADGASSSSNGMDRTAVSTIIQDTLESKKLYASGLGGSRDDFGSNLHGSAIDRNSGRLLPKSHARITGGEVCSGDGITLVVEPNMASVMTDSNSGLDHGNSSSAGIDSDYVVNLTASVTEVSEGSNSYNKAGPISRAGANTPVDVAYLQQSENTANNGFVSAEELVVLETGTSVMDKIRHWEGLSKVDYSPLVHTEFEVGKLSDWEAQSWRLESDVVHPVVEDTHWRENEVEATLGEILIKRIVEKTRKGSHIVREAQTVLASEYGEEPGESCQTSSACTLESSVHNESSSWSELEDGMTYLDLSGDAEHGKEQSGEGSDAYLSCLSDPVLRMLGPDCGYTGLEVVDDVSGIVGRRSSAVRKGARGPVPYYVL